MMRRSSSRVRLKPESPQTRCAHRPMGRTFPRQRGGHGATLTRNDATMALTSFGRLSIDAGIRCDTGDTEGSSGCVLLVAERVILKKRLV